jgi:catechol 2,3-dioxygenase-like lactoylglutathione lyase family enzyme
MRLDHIAYRAKDRYKTAQFFQDCLGYTIGTEFDLKFDDGTTTDCIALAPPEARPIETSLWTLSTALGVNELDQDVVYHAPPEIFVSDGPEGSIVGDWVSERGGIGGVHHIAYEVEDVEAVMNEWKDKGYAEFYSEKPLVCEETHLVQVFTKPSELTGVIYELIKRGKDNKGFCEVNVKGLMESTRGK